MQSTVLDIYAPCAHRNTMMRESHGRVRALQPARDAERDGRQHTGRRIAALQNQITWTYAYDEEKLTLN